jgi:hypothetical protein
MFGKKKFQKMDLFNTFQPTSKSSIKTFCMKYADGDIKKASELYDFYIKDMEDLPVFDPAQPTWIDNTKEAVGNLLDFVKQNKDGFSQVYDVIKGIAAARGKILPPAEALPNINE